MVILFMNKLFLLVTAFLLCFAQARANSITYSFNFSGSGTTSSGYFTTVTGTGGADDITGISGVFKDVPGGFSGTITGLGAGSYSATNPTSSNNTVFDNLYYARGSSASCSGQPGGGVFDFCGLDFFVRSGSGTLYEVNLFGTGGTGTGYQIIDHLANSSTTIQNNAPVTFTDVAIAPEPASWSMVLTGLLGAAGIAKRRFAVDSAV